MKTIARKDIISAAQLQNMYIEDRDSDCPTYLNAVDLDENSGCSESCEVYFTEEN